MRRTPSPAGGCLDRTGAHLGPRSRVLKFTFRSSIVLVLNEMVLAIVLAPRGSSTSPAKAEHEHENRTISQAFTQKTVAIEV